MLAARFVSHAQGEDQRADGERLLVIGEHCLLYTALADSSDLGCGIGKGQIEFGAAGQGSWVRRWYLEQKACEWLSYSTICSNTNSAMCVISATSLRLTVVSRR